MRIDVEQMRTFVCVAEYGSIAKASEVMESSQSTINSRMKAISKELGMTLFERRGRGVTLTEKGELFLGYVIRTLDLLDEGISEVNRAKEQSQQLTVAADPSMGTWFLPQACTEFRLINPDANTRINVSASSTIVDWVLNGKVDLGLVQGLVTHKGVEAIKIFSSPLIPIFHKTHPLAKKDVLTPEDLAGQKLIVPYERTEEWELIRLWFEKHKIAYPELITADHPETMKQFVMRNIGYTFTTSIAVNEELISGNLQTVPLQPPLMLSQESYMIVHKNLPLTDIARQFRDFLADMRVQVLADFRVRPRKTKPSPAS